ncbi:XRE family transcriptional regulator [Microbacterium hominis]|uniref:XRE family transcriptional regulator n=1 Tax=Microbacterium TaxID=33882 RepID=UPI00168B1632|nr:MULTISPECIES: XRE family transcriptional regulator [Microbacterium]QOC24803.1 XRE family transcriptional regulator [Microbacterium hominis]QOC28857.1 XRE family transcriptional regulator [Microbacterium hominis]QYF98942.1 hypothetical protein KY498_06930 [Microbacterium sp. PAMC21962]
MTKQTVADEQAIALCEEVRVEMARHRRTSADLAVVIDVTPHTAGRRLKAAPPFTMGELFTLAPWLGVTVAELISRVEASAALTPDPQAVAS